MGGRALVCGYRIKETATGSKKHAHTTHQTNKGTTRRVSFSLWDGLDAHTEIPHSRDKSRKFLNSYTLQAHSLSLSLSPFSLSGHMGNKTEHKPNGSGDWLTVGHWWKIDPMRMPNGGIEKRTKKNRFENEIDIDVISVSRVNRPVPKQVKTISPLEYLLSLPFWFTLRRALSV